MKLFTLVEGYPTKVGIVRLFGEVGKIARRTHGTTLPRDKKKDLATIHHPKMDRAYAEICYLYVFWGPENSSHLPGNIVITDIYAKDREKN